MLEAELAAKSSGCFSNVFNPGKPVRLRRFFLFEMELGLIAGKLSKLK